MLAPMTVVLLLTGGAGHGVGPAVRWERQFDQALKKAQGSGKPIMVDFWAEWCGWCHRLDQTTYVDPVVMGLMADFVTVKVNTEGSARESAVALRYDVTTLPTITFLSPSGRQVMRLNGFQGPGQFPATLEAAKAQAAKVMAWEAALDHDAKDAAALTGLGIHLFEQEIYEESRELLLRASSVDASRPAKERKRTRMLLGMIQKYDHKYPEAEALLKEALGVKPPGDDDAKILFLLGKTYLSWGKPEQARSVLQEVLDAHPRSTVAPKASETLAALDRRN
jgi:thioredoxin-like negative regulator of GroEL